MSKVLITSIANIALSVGLILANKSLVVNFKFKHMTFLSCLHFISSMICSFVMVKIGFVSYKPATNYFHVIRISVGSLLSIIFMNYCLAESSVGFYQISKLACIPTILLLESILGIRNQTLSMGLMGSLLLIIIGMVLVIQQEIIFNIRGVMWAAIGVVTTSLAQIFFGPLQKELGLDSIQLLYHTSPWLVISSAATLPYVEDISHLVMYPFSSSCIIVIGLTCVISVLFNVSNYQLLTITTPLTYTILGHLKTLLVIIGGSYFYPTMTSAKMYMGIVTAFVGAMAYKWVLDRQQ